MDARAPAGSTLAIAATALELALVVAIALALALAITPATKAHAQARQSAGTQTRTDADTDTDRDIDPLAWRAEWARFDVWEYVAAPALLVGAGAVFLFAPLDTPGWVGGIGPDDWVAREVRAPRGSSTRDAWDLAGDLFYVGALANSVLDPLVAAGLVGGNWDTAAQLMLINFETYATVTAILMLTQLAVRRARPRADAACEGPTPDDTCEGQAVRSFPGGHLTIAATNAALTCQHHGHLPLYGGGIPDYLACAFWSAGTAVIFMARMATDEHYLTDQLVALVLGLGAGILIPELLHYGAGPPRHGDGDADVDVDVDADADADVASAANAGPAPRSAGIRTVILPLLTDGTIGVAATAIF